jgi:hypothetical protein
MVDFFHALHRRGLDAKDLLSENSNKTTLDVLIRVVAPDAFAITKRASTAAQPPPESSKELPTSEIGRLGQMHRIALQDPDFLNGESPIKKIKKKKENADDVGPEGILGKVIRVYNPVDNQYHHGRIIDWRSGRLVKEKDGRPLIDHADQFYASNEIGKSEFLIRFPSGINGRKEEIMKWIVFEEHSCAVSGSLVMALKDKGRGINGWRPAHVLYRTVIELIPVVDYITNGGNDGLLLFIDNQQSLYSNLKSDAVDLFSKDFERYRMNRFSRSTDLKTSYEEGIAPMAEKVMSLIKIELEEQRRTMEWHKKIQVDYAHPKCLSMKSEYGLPPLEINQSIQDDESNQDELNGQHDEKADSTNVKMNQPKLCPLFQHGLDRQLISDLIYTGRKFTLDDVASLTCLSSKSKAEKIAMLKKSKF